MFFERQLNPNHQPPTEGWIISPSRLQSSIDHGVDETATEGRRYDLEVDGQGLTFPFPFVHHQPLRIILTFGQSDG